MAWDGRRVIVGLFSSLLFMIIIGMAIEPLSNSTRTQVGNIDGRGFQRIPHSEKLEIGIILSSSDEDAFHLDYSEHTLSQLDTMIFQQLKTWLLSNKANIHLYIAVPHIPRQSSQNRKLYSIRERKCAGTTAVQEIDCLGTVAFQEGVDYVLLIDYMELNEPENPQWIQSAIEAVNNTGNADWIPAIRQMGVSGRGFQLKSKLQKQQPYMQERYINSWSSILPDKMFWQYKPWIQFSPSICVHASHFKALGYLFPDTLHMQDALHWISHSYKFIHTHVVSPPPPDYQNNRLFLFGNYSLSDIASKEVEIAQFQIMNYQVTMLLSYYNIGTCKDVDKFYSLHPYDPKENTHSSKVNLTIGFSDHTKARKLFLYNALSVQEAIRNLRSMLLLYNSPYIPKLIAFCSEKLQFATEFVESAGNIYTASRNMNCESKIHLWMEQIKSIQELHSIGVVQCDWKYSQWIVENESNRLLLVDLDDTRLIPTDCGQSQSHLHSPIQNFHAVHKGSIDWPEDYTLHVFDTQFLRDMNRGGYVTFDKRHDIYHLGLPTFSVNFLGFPKGDCPEFFTNITALVSDINTVYPPPLDEIYSRLKQLLYLDPVDG